MTPKERNARWRATNPEKHLASNRASRRRHLSTIRVKNAAWRKANPEKERARYVAWAAANPARERAKYARRRARERSQLCKCCTPADVEAIYFACPRGYEVDHRMPLALGGLHCANNLQALSKAEHATKTAEDLRDIGAFKAAMRAIDAASKRKPPTTG